MALTKDHNIINFDEFETSTNIDRRQLAGLYFFMVLDRLVYLAEWLSHDRLERPGKYSEVDDASILLLANLRSKSGKDPLFPSREEREQIYVPIFGTAGSASADFPRLRDSLMQAAADFANRQTGTGFDALIEGFRTALRPFKRYLDNVNGASVRFSRDPVLAELTELTAYSILRSDSMASAWGYGTEPTADWPYADEGQPSEMVDEMFEYFSARMNPDETETSTPAQGFSELQELALRGAEAIATCIDVSAAAPPDDIEDVIDKVFAWHCAMRPWMQPA